MVAESWGPNAWYFLHKLSITYDAQKKNKYARCVKLFAELIPCPLCEYHFKQTLNNTSIDKILVDTQHFFAWTVYAHNKVNIRNQKKVYMISDAIKIYNKNFDKNLIIGFINEFYRSNRYNRSVFKEFLLLIFELFPNNKIRENLMNFNKKFNNSNVDINSLHIVIINIINITKL